MVVVVVVVVDGWLVVVVRVGYLFTFIYLLITFQYGQLVWQGCGRWLVKLVAYTYV